MTVETTARRAQYDTNGTTGPFTVPFYFLEDSHLQVIHTDAGGVETTLTLTTDFTVTGAGVESGGTVATVASFAAGGFITILRDVPALQETDYTETDAFPAASHERALDLLTMIVQQQAEVIARALVFPPTEQPTVQLPAAADRALKLLSFDEAGNPIASVPGEGTATALAFALAGSDGAGMVGFDEELGYPDGSVGDALQNAGSILVDVRKFGAKVDGTTDDTDALDDALADPHAEVFVQEGALKVTATPADVYGPRLGPGSVLRVLDADGNTQRMNPEADLFRHVFGQEYLAYAQTKIRLRAGFSAVFSGDSTTAGDSIGDTEFHIHNLVQQAVREKTFDLTVTNAGHSGATTEQWRTTYLATDLAANPDLYVIRWGINDPYYLKSGSAGAADEWEAEKSLRRDVTDFATSLRAALTTIRAAKTVAQMSVILMMPNSTSDSPNGRDEKWYEQIKGVCRKAARDFQCAFIDTYSLWNDSRPAAGRWMDNPYSDGRAIHPLATMNLWIASEIADLLVPSAMAMRNIPSDMAVPQVTTLPSAYPVGYSTYRVFPAWSINGVSVNGMVTTHRGVDGVTMQQVVDYSTQRRIAERVGRVDTDTWQDWISAPTNTTTLTLSNSWIDTSAGRRGITYDKVGGLVHIRGRISSGTTTFGTVIATLPSGFRPVFDEYRAVVCGATLNTFAAIRIATSGEIICVAVSDNTYLDVGCTFSIY